MVRKYLTPTTYQLVALEFEVFVVFPSMFPQFCADLPKNDANVFVLNKTVCLHLHILIDA
jgi:hypothetical protein